MTVLNFRLRTKSMLALAAACLLALVPTVLIGLEALERARAHFGQAYAENFTLLNAQKIEAPLIKELALARTTRKSLTAKTPVITWTRKILTTTGFSRPWRNLTALT